MGKGVSANGANIKVGGVELGDHIAPNSEVSTLQAYGVGLAIVEVDSAPILERA